MADVFSEVDEQVRSARLQAMTAKAWPYALALAAIAAVAVLVWWVLASYRTAQAGEASQAYAAAVQKLTAGDMQGAQSGFAALSVSSTPAYRTLALMQRAGLRAKAGDSAGAATLLDQAAAVAPNPVMADAARLEAAYDVMDAAGYDAVRARLEPLLGVGRPYRDEAREALAIARLAGGRIPEAKGDFQVLSLSSDVSDTTRTRAQAALGMIQTGGAANLAAIAKAAVGLKPIPQAPPAGDPAQASSAQASSAQASSAQASAAAQAAAAQSPAGDAQPSGAKSNGAQSAAPGVAP